MTVSVRTVMARAAVFLLLCTIWHAPRIQAQAKAAPGSGTIVDRHPLQLSPAVAQSSADLLKHVHVEAITYMSDGLRIKGYLAVPEGAGPFPCVILNRGGNQVLGVFDDEHALHSLGKIASWGYVVVASQYRGAAGSEGRDEYGGADVDDVLNLIPLLESVPTCDRARIGMYGASRGGMMTYLALARTDRVKAAIVLSGMSDLTESVRSRPQMGSVFQTYIPGFDANPGGLLKQRSAIYWVNKLPANVPILILHGSADWRVAPSQALDMARGLLEARHPVRLVMFEGGAHGVPEFGQDRDALMRQWLDNYLRDGKKWPDPAPHGE